MRDKHSSKKILLTIALLIIGIISATGLIMTTRQPEARVSTTKPAQQKVEAAQTPAHRLAYKGQEGKTALELLKQKAKTTTKQSAYGEYVDSINGLGGGTDGKYWAFYINGAASNVGAGAYTTKSTDNIEWKYE